MKKYVMTILAVLLFPAAVFAGDTGDILTVALSAGEITVDPLHAYRTDELQIATGIYEGLVAYDPNTLRPVPGVAYKWDVSEDGTRYTFYLRERAKFSNGDPVTAADFRDSWLRIIDPREEGEYSFLFDVIKGVSDYRNGENGDPGSVGIDVSSRFVLEVELEKPAGHFLSMLPHMSFAPIYQSYRESAGWENSAPLISNGPFVLTGWSGEGLVLERNPAYWDRWNVTLDEIKILTNTTAAENADLLNDGRVQWADYADTGIVEDRGLFQISALFATSYIYFRADAEPWSDPRVRKGIALLIPWNEVRSEVTPYTATTLVPEVGFYEKPAGLEEVNVSEGLKLLADAGYPDGRGLPDITAVVTPGSVAEAVIESAARLWEERLGVKTEITRVSFGDYQEITQRGGYVFGSSTWIGDFADPLSFLQMWTTGSKLNDARYASEEYDLLIEEALAESGDERYEIYAKAEELLLSGDTVVIPLSNPPSLNFVDLDRISGWYANALDIHPFKNIGFRESRVPKWYVSLPFNNVLQRGYYNGNI